MQVILLGFAKEFNTVFLPSFRMMLYCCLIILKFHFSVIFAHEEIYP
jgi:hypothetical protein